VGAAQDPLDVPDTTAESVDSGVAASTGDLAVDFASKTVYDTTVPSQGQSSSPASVQAGPINVTFNDVIDEGGSGLARATLWVKEGDSGQWSDTGLIHDFAEGDSAGAFAYANVLGEGRYHFALRVEDKAGNVTPDPDPAGAGATVTVLDNSTPVITLVGGASLVFESGGTYVDPGATAQDTTDGDLSDSIVVANPVNAAVPGTYQVSYNVSDSAGNAATEAIRAVTIVESTNTYGLAVVQPPAGQGTITFTPPNAANGRYAPGTEVALAYSPSTDYDIVGWTGAVSDPANLAIAMVVMDTNRSVAVTVASGIGSVAVNVTPNDASWTVTDSSGGTHAGSGDSTLNNIPIGDVSIEYLALSGFDTPTGESAVLAKNATVNFAGSYEGGTQYALSAPRTLAGGPGTILDCPITVSTGQDLVGFNVSLTFDSALVEVESVTTGGLVSAWGAPDWSPSSGSVQVSRAGEALSGGGSGALAVVRFRVKDTVSESGTTELTFSASSLSSATGPVSDVSTTAGLLAVELGEFLWADADGNGTVDSTDANILLRYVAGLESEIPSASEVNDPDGLGGMDVSVDDPPFAGAYDAALILQLAEGELGAFPADLNGDGMGPDLAEDSQTLADLLVDAIDSGVERVVQMSGSLNVEPGTTIEVPVALDSGDRVLSYQMDLMYDDTVLTFDNLSGGTLTQSWLSPAVNAVGGRLSMAAAGVSDTRGSGTLAIVTFRVSDAVEPATITPLSFGEVRINDGRIPVSTVDQVVTPTISRITPKSGGDLGGQVVTVIGTNLGDVDTVFFGNVAAEHVFFQPASGDLLAVSPAGFGKVDVTVSAAGAESTLTSVFTYQQTDVRLDLEPEDDAVAGSVFSIPVLMQVAATSLVNEVTFVLKYDRNLFTALPPAGTELVALGDTGGASGVSVAMKKPGDLSVTLSGALQSGHLCTVNLVSLGGDGANAESLLYISNVDAQGTTTVAGGG
jgi:hypothetical protein